MIVELAGSGSILMTCIRLVFIHGTIFIIWGVTSLPLWEITLKLWRNMGLVGIQEEGSDADFSLITQILVWDLVSNINMALW